MSVTGPSGRSPRGIARALFDRAERGLDVAFGPAWNPLHQLGALGWLYYWVVLVSGIYLYAFFDTGLERAYESLERITHTQWYAGGIMRSLHRYASAALVVVVIVHLLREWAQGRLQGPRCFAWITGVPLLWMLFAAGLSGYWLVWDQLAQYVAIATTEWLDALGLFGEPIARNFVHSNVLTGRFFTLMVFIHIAVPLFMLFAMWVHIYRHARPRVNPPRGLALGTLAALVLLSLLHPAVSQGGPANLDRVPAVVHLDWFYLAVLPLADLLGGRTIWLLVGVATLVLLALPWLPRARPAPAAVVDPANCNGCGRCVADCPYSAVDLQPRSDGLPFTHLAVVSPERCVACGICVGACPTAMPFRRSTELRAGIELPELSVEGLREQCLQLAGRLTGTARVLVFRCRHGVAPDGLDGEEVASVELPCVGMLPPAFVDLLVTRAHVDGVFLTGCAEGACRDRLGIAWTRGRMAGERDPRLRARVPEERVCLYFGGRAREAQTRERLAAFRDQLSALKAPHRARAPAPAPGPVAASDA